MGKIKGIYRIDKADVVIVDITEFVNYFSRCNKLSIEQVINYFADSDFHFFNSNSRRFL